MSNLYTASCKLGLFKAERLTKIIDYYYHFYHLRRLYDSVNFLAI